MQIKIGNKIRELRYRDNRRQEDLANALGVTCQAVSRWESNGCYPDMEMIPSIANFFNTSIDELFGYDGDRQEKIDEILIKSEKMIASGEDLTECIVMLREAVYRFPSEPHLLLNLGYALHVHGWKVYGLKGKTNDESDYGSVDTEYASKNIFWKEAMSVFEKLLTMDNVPEREVVTLLMVSDYSKMGEFSKAKELAKSQSPVFASRECLLVHASEESEREKYLGEAVFTLLDELKKNIETAATTKKSLVKSGESQKILLSLVKFYEDIFEDGRFGKFHSNMRDLYLQISMLEAGTGDINKAVEYFDNAYNHHIKLLELENVKEYRYSAPLVSMVVHNHNCFPKALRDGLKDYLKNAPEALLREIKKNTKYSECF